MQQDWIWGLIGGGLIGLGGAVYLLGNGRIMGASGILGGLVDGSGKNTAVERLVFLFGVIVLPIILTPLYNVEINTHVTDNWLVIIAAGLIIGWQLIIPAYLIGIILGAVISVVLIATKRKKRGDEIPFGPFLCIGVMASVFFGQELINWYLGLL